MENTVYESSTVIANYLTEIKLIQLRWKKQSNTDEYRKMFQALVDFAQKNEVRFIISDMRQEGFVSVDDAKWLEEEILKKAIDLGVEKIALINEGTIFSAVYADSIKRKLLKSPVKVQLFDEMNSAKAWLTAE